ncbi:MAG: SUMF1/EgtB/PvdO family nonheme iron enzyme [Bacteroidota bacterium]
MRAPRTFLVAVVTCFVLCSAFSGKEDPIFSKKLKEYPYVPSGSFYPASALGNTDGLDPAEKITIAGFFIAEKEVTNAEYRRFLDDLKANGRIEDLAKAKIHNNNWIIDSNVNEPWANTYHIHEAFDDYPVVNISHEGAQLYCQWLTEQLHAQFPEYSSSYFRLPTKEEFSYAAQGGHELAPYSWGGYGLRNAKGEYLANFRRIGSESITRDQETGELKLLHSTSPQLRTPNYGPSPSTSFLPNDYGAYHMCGNVAEMTMEKGLAMGGSWRAPGYDIRVYSEMNYDEPSPEVGFRPVMSIRTRHIGNDE